MIEGKTLYAIEVLMRIYCRGSHPDGSFSAPDHENYARAVTWLRDHMLLSMSIASGALEVTPRGRVYIEALRAVSLPVETVTWSVPGFDLP